MDPSETMGSITSLSPESSYLFSLFPLSVDSLVGVSQVLAMCGLPVPQTNPFPVLVPLQGRPLREQQEVATAVIQRCYRKYKQVIL